MFDALACQQTLDERRVEHAVIDELDAPRIDPDPPLLRQRVPGVAEIVDGVAARGDAVDFAIHDERDQHLEEQCQPEIVFVKGDGAYMWSADGRRYIDYHAAFAPHDATALRNRQFDDAGIQMVAACPATSSRARLDCFKFHELALRFRYDFVFDNENVARE